METLAKRFGQLIRSERGRQMLTQRALAQKAGCTETLVVRIEHGQNPQVQMKKALDVAKALNIEPERLGRLLLGIVE